MCEFAAIVSCMGRLTMGSPPPSRVFLAANKSRAGDVCKRGSLAVAERYINMLTPARLDSAEQGCHDRV